MESSIYSLPWLFNSVTKAFSSHTAVELARKLSCTIDITVNCPSITVARTEPGQSISRFLYKYFYKRTYLSTLDYSI